MIMKKLFRLLRYDWPLHFVLLLTNWLPDNIPFLQLRGALARPFFGSCGCNLRLGRNLCFYNPSVIKLGRDVYVAYGSWFMGGEEICIGDEVLIGPYCVVASSNHTRSEGSFRYGKSDQVSIDIHPGCWLASHVTVTAGSTIGKGALIAAGSVVTGVIPADVIAGGTPAHTLRELREYEN